MSMPPRLLRGLFARMPPRRDLSLRRGLELDLTRLGSSCRWFERGIDYCFLFFDDAFSFFFPRVERISVAGPLTCDRGTLFGTCTVGYSSSSSCSRSVDTETYSALLQVRGGGNYRTRERRKKKYRTVPTLYFFRGRCWPKGPTSRAVCLTSSIARRHQITVRWRGIWPWAKRPPHLRYRPSVPLPRNPSRALGCN